jgi:Papain family cysteine protease
MLFSTFFSFGQGCLFDSVATAQLPFLEIDTFKSLSGSTEVLSCPPVQDQGNCNSGVAWALSYYALSIIRSNEDAKILSNPFSPSIICETTNRCGTGLYVQEGMTVIRNYARRYPHYEGNVPTCGSKKEMGDTLQPELLYFNQLNEAPAAVNLFMQRVKQEIGINNRPVILLIRCNEQLKSLKNAEWIPTSRGLRASKDFQAVCAIGYSYDNDCKEDYIQIVNSWGTGWGKDGFAKIRCADIQNIVVAAYSLKSLE